VVGAWQQCSIAKVEVTDATGTLTTVRRTSQLSYSVPKPENRVRVHMPYETPKTVKEAVESIRLRKYVLPSIQREFIWDESQIETLFDSLLQGYPIGSLMFWRAQGETVSKFQFYDFVQHFHERDRRHNPKSAGGREEVTVVIDGQQRLTSLYIGLLGSFARKTKYARFDNPYAYQDRKLYLNLTGPAAEGELGDRFQLKFLTDNEFQSASAEGDWFHVGRILDFTARDILKFVKEQEYAEDSFALDALSALHSAIIERPVLPYYLETEQDIDKVLEIFIRVNSQGTPLAKADLLMSIATAHWQHRDAREEIHKLVDELNRAGGFYFEKNFVLKASLVLTGADVAFKVDNFNRQNISEIERRWDDIAEALRTSVELVARYGYNGSTLLTNNALIPIAYYLFNSRTHRAFLDSSKYATDRDSVRQWLALVILQQTFGGQTDSILRWIREAMIAAQNGFPSRAIEARLAREGRSLILSEEGLNSFLDYTYSDRYTFSVLSLLYPGMPTARPDVDHIHPRAFFGIRELKRQGIPEDKWEKFQSARDRLGNLQLLEGVPNREKSDKPFDEWLNKEYPQRASRDAYMNRNLIPEVDLSFGGVLEFVKERERLILSRLKTLVY
jgi:uncharacterized protein with ParB-like and HNH nuclease domain